MSVRSQSSPFVYLTTDSLSNLRHGGVVSEEASVDGEHLSSDEGCRFGGQKDDNPRDVFRPSELRGQRILGVDGNLVRRHIRFERGRRDHSGCDRIRANTFLPVLCGDRLREGAEPGL